MKNIISEEKNRNMSEEKKNHIMLEEKNPEAITEEKKSREKYRISKKVRSNKVNIIKILMTPSMILLPKKQSFNKMKRDSLIAIKNKETSPTYRRNLEK